MRRFVLALAVLCGLTVGALAQGCGPQNPNCIVPTAPPGTSNNQAASTAFVGSAVSTQTAASVAAILASGNNNAPQLQLFRAQNADVTTILGLFTGRLMVIGAQSLGAPGGGNAIFGAGVQDVNNAGGASSVFPVGVTGLGVVTASGTSNYAYGLFGRCDLLLVVGSCEGAEVNCNQQNDAPNIFPPNLTAPVTNWECNGIQSVNIGPGKGHIAFRAVATGGAWLAGFYADPPRTGGLYSGFLDATAANSPFVTLLVRNSGQGSNQPLLIQTVGAAVSGNPVIQHQNTNAATATTFQVNQNGNIISNASTSVTPPAGNLWLANDGSASLNMDSFGTAALNTISMRGARGTGASPANLAQNDLLGFIGARPFVNGAYGTFSAVMQFNYTDPNPATGKTGSNITFQTTVKGATARSTMLTLQDSGGLSVGTALDPGTNSVAIAGGFSTSGPTPVNTNTYTLLNTDTSLFVTGTASVTLTLTGALTGRWLYISNFAAFTVVSASSNVIAVGSGATGTAILAATIGKWAILNYDGTNWRIVANN